MEIIKYSNLVVDEIKREKFGVPFFVCTKAARAARRFEEADYQKVSINKVLSKTLLNYLPDERCRHVEESLKKLLHKQESIMVYDFEMLFDPRYEIDVIKFFCDQARVKNIAVIWPGDYKGTKLTYAELGDSDYHEYNCNTYQLRIVL